MSFEIAVSFVLGLEGGYSNDKRDPGGETKYGISRRAFPWMNIKTLTHEGAVEIYRKYYWDAAGCNDLPWPLAGYVFDGAVNQGVMATVRNLQAALGVRVDGIIGPVTILAAQSNAKEQAALFMAERASDYMKLSSFSVYGRGWMKRLFLVAGEFT